MLIDGNKYFMCEVQSVVSTRRFYLGEFQSDDEKGIGANFVLCMDEQRDGKGIQYMTLPDPMMFSESVTYFSRDKYIAHKILDSEKDKEVIHRYKENVMKFRAENVGLVRPPNKVQPING